MWRLSHFGILIILTSHFYFYAAVIYILCYNSGVAGQGPGVWTPLSCQKSCLNRANLMRIFLG